MIVKCSLFFLLLAVCTAQSVAGEQSNGSKLYFWNNNNENASRLYLMDMATKNVSHIPLGGDKIEKSYSVDSGMVICDGILYSVYTSMAPLAL